MGIEQRIKQIQQQIIQAANKYQRNPNEIKLLAVSKGQPVDKIKQAYQYGIRNFGENYLQEALRKKSQLSAEDLCWHFIGSIQSNKSQEISQEFDWVHSVSRIKIARLLNDNRLPQQTPLNICVQVNLTGEKTKSGIPKDEVIPLVKQCLQFNKLNCRGLMTILPLEINEQQKLLLFQELKQLLFEINIQTDSSMDTLSMGMSNDFLQAIQAGSTIIRIGRSLFGERENGATQ